jgi:hypothetical protein
MVELARRTFLAGLGALLVTAPAIVRATSIMPVKAYEPIDSNEIMRLLEQRLEHAQQILERNIKEYIDREVYGTRSNGTRGGLAGLISDHPAPYTRCSPGMIKDERTGLWTFA